MAPSVAWGRSLRSGASTSATTRASATVTSSLIWVRAPASALTSVCEKPPAAGTVWKKAPATEAAPTATSSRSLSSAGSVVSLVARATEMLSR